MSTTYRESRNLEGSIVQFLEAKLTQDKWSGISVVKGWPQDYKGKIPLVGVEALEKRPRKLEIGSGRHIIYRIARIRLFCTSDGQRLDLSDWIFSKLESEDIPYYEYKIVEGKVSEKILAGKISITRWLRHLKELQNTEGLEREDKFREIIEFEARIVLKN